MIDDRGRFVLRQASGQCCSTACCIYRDDSARDLDTFGSERARQGLKERLHPGRRNTTGPLARGRNAVGMAVPKLSCCTVQSPGMTSSDHQTTLASDGDVMEGVSHEASLCRHSRWGNHRFYDDNHITIEGDTELTFSDDTAKRYESYGWHVQRVDDANDLDAIDSAIVAAKEIADRPSLVVLRSHIGFGSPNKQGTAEAHGSPLGPDEIRLTKEALGYPSQEPFYVAPEALEQWRKCLRVVRSRIPRAITQSLQRNVMRRLLARPSLRVSE